MQVRRVTGYGYFSWKHEDVFLSEVGLLPIDERHYEVYFVSTPLARFDSYRLRVQFLPGAAKRPRSKCGNLNNGPKCKTCPRSEM
jgi:hypothetical protein